MAITPTVGRIIYFHPASNSTHRGFKPNALCAAQIAAVLPDGKLNLGVLDANGAHHAMTNVPFIQDSDTPPEDGYYAEWHSEPAPDAPEAASPSENSNPATV